MKLKDWILFVATLATGLLIAYIDSRPGWDDSGVTAAMIFFAAGFAAAVSPKKFWLWALLISAWIPLRGILLSHDFSMLLVLLFGIGGASASRFIRGMWDRSGEKIS